MSKPTFKIESGMQLLARLTKKPDMTNFYPALFENGPNYGDFIELSSDRGTSYVLIDLICEALNSNKMGTAGVLLFNTDGNLDYNQLLVQLKKKLYFNNQDKGLSDSDLEVILCETISNFHILKIYDASQLYITIHNLESILMDYPNIALVIFDTLTAFYWSEQCFKITRMDLYIKNLIQCIYKATKDYKIICLYTKPSYFGKNKLDNNIDLSNIHLVSYRICIAKNIEYTNMYEVSVLTNETQFIKNCSILENQLKWH